MATPELFAAARRSLEFRGDGGTGWSKAWKVNFLARLHDGDRVREYRTGPANGSSSGHEDVAHRPTRRVRLGASTDA